MTQTKTGKKKRAPTRKQRIAKLEQQIAELEKTLPDADKLKGVRIERQIRLLSEQLRIERIHAVSKFSSIRRYAVSGCYGTGRRTN